MCVKSHSSLSGSCWLLMSVHLGKESVFWSPVTVLPQEAEIDSIHQLVVGATENIKEGNEDIREVSTLGPPRSPQCGTTSGQQPPSCWHGCLSALLGPSPQGSPDGTTQPHLHPHQTLGPRYYQET